MSGLCVTAPIEVPDGCSWYGLEFPCAVAFDHTNPPFVHALWLVHYGVAGMLFLIALANLFVYQRELRQHYAEPKKYCNPWMRLLHVGYPFITGWFALFRFNLQLGVPLVAGAAIHNWFEWGLVFYAFVPEEVRRRRYFLTATLWIWTVCTLVSTLPMAVGIFSEQSTGILLDFWLPAIWYTLWKQAVVTESKRNGSPGPVTAMYRKAFIAAFIHVFFTILPLVFENFAVAQNEFFSRTLEGILLLSTPATHILYTVFAGEFQKLVIEESMQKANEKAALEKCKAKVADAMWLLPNSEPDAEVVPGQCEDLYETTILLCSSEDAAAEDGLVLDTTWLHPDTRKEGGMQFKRDMLPKMVLYAMVGLVVLLGVPVVLGTCSATDPPLESRVCEVSGTCPAEINHDHATPTGLEMMPTFSSLAIANVRPGMDLAFERRIREVGLIEKARAAPGNVHYNLYRKDSTSRYEFHETWADKRALDTWQAGHPKEVFGNEIMQSFLIGGGLVYPDRPVQMQLEQVNVTEGDEGSGHVRFEFEGGCEKLWSDIADRGSCVWVAGCKGSSVKGNTERRLDFDSKHEEWNRTLFEPEIQRMAYTVPATGFAGDVSLVQEEGQCRVDYLFSGAESADQVYLNLLEVQKPHILRRYGVAQ